VSTFYELATPQCSAEEFDGEIVAINLDSGIYFSMKAPASWIFSDLCRDYSVETILNTLPSKNDLHLTVDKFIRELVTAGLIRPKEGCVEPNDAPFLASVPIENLTRPVLEPFGDMQSLLLLDPVHDVDEAMGWPVLSKPDFS
jgi:hypothetical protein